MAAAPAPSGLDPSAVSTAPVAPSAVPGDQPHRPQRKARSEATCLLCHADGLRWVMRMWESTQLAARAGDRYLLLADISGYTAFMASVESAHGVDFSAGIPAGFAILGELLDGVIEGVQPDFEVIKLEGDAVFAVAPAASLDGRGGDVLDRLQALYETFRTRREVARAARDHVCTACPVVSNLDLKMVLHRGQAIRQTVGSQTELLGPAVNVVHRLLKNSIQAHLGYRPYVFLTDAAAAWLHLAELGVEHREDYPDVGPVSGRVVPLGESPGQSIPGAADAPDRLSEGLSMGRSDGLADPIVSAESAMARTSAPRSNRRPC